MLVVFNEQTIFFLLNKNNREKKKMASTSITTQILNIDSKELTKGQIIGRGKFGQVYECYWKGACIVVAVKELLVQMNDKKSTDTFKKEAEVMAQCRHPNTVQLFGICLEEGKVGFVMEYVERGSLDRVLAQEKDLDWRKRYGFAGDICKGLNYLHGQKIVHCDLKSLNILITKEYSAKISDFGLSKTRQESQAGFGTARWMAPEQLSSNVAANEKTDIYSVGMIFWEIASQKIPFSHANNEQIILVWKLEGRHETIPLNTPKQFAQIIEQCWQEDAEKRPSAYELTQSILNIYNNNNSNGSNDDMISKNDGYYDSSQNNNQYPSNLFASHYSSFSKSSNPSNLFDVGGAGDALKQMKITPNNSTANLNPTTSITTYQDLCGLLVDLLDNKDVQSNKDLKEALEKKLESVIVVSATNQLVVEDVAYFNMALQLLDGSKKVRDYVAKKLTATATQKEEISSSKIQTNKQQTAEQQVGEDDYQKAQNFAKEKNYKEAIKWYQKSADIYKAVKKHFSKKNRNRLVPL